MRIKKSVLGYPIWAEVQKLDEGWDVALFGGCSTHVGAVSLAGIDGTVETLERPGHKDGFLTQKWADTLARQKNAPVCVRCGIHYDHATKEQLAIIISSCEEMLRELQTMLERERNDGYGNDLYFE